MYWCYQKLHNLLSYRALLTIYKCFIRLNLHFGYFIYEQPNDSICSKKGRAHYNGKLAITG